MASGRGPWNSSVSSAESLSPASHSRWRRGVWQRVAGLSAMRRRRHRLRVHFGSPRRADAALCTAPRHGAQQRGRPGYRQSRGSISPHARFCASALRCSGLESPCDQIGGLGWYNGGCRRLASLVTIGFGWALARALGLSRRLGILTGGATAICGASAAIAIATVLPRDERSERELIFTIAGVHGAVDGRDDPLPDHRARASVSIRNQAGIFLGGTIHDVAQVVGAGYSISPEVGDYAVLTKLMRVAMLLPVVMAHLAVRPASTAACRRPREAIRYSRRFWSPSSRSSSSAALAGSRNRLARR